MNTFMRFTRPLLRQVTPSLLLLLLCAGTSAAADAILIQGKLTGAGGKALGGTRAWLVKFHDAPAGGTQLGGNLTGTVAVAAGGRFAIEVTPPAPVLAAAGDVYYELGIDSAATPDGAVGPGDMFAGRVKLNAMLRARRAAAADRATTAGFAAQADRATSSASALNAERLGGRAAAEYATTAYLAGQDFASRTWVGAQDYATRGWVDGQNFATQSWVEAGKAALAHTHAKTDLKSSGTLGFAWSDAEVADGLTVQGGAVSHDSFSAYADLNAEGKLDNDDGADLLTRGQADARYAATGADAVLSGSLTVDRPTFFVDRTTHRVAVGTLTPQNKFQVNGRERMDQENAAALYQYNVNKSQWQSFTPAFSGYLTRIDYYGAQYTGTTGTLTLYAGEDTVGTVLAATTFTVGITYDWHSIALPSPVPVVAGSRYTWGFSDAHVALGVTNNTYPNGISSITTRDYRFRTHMEDLSQAVLSVSVAGNVGLGVAQPQRTAHVKDVLRLEPLAAAPANPAEGDIYMDKTLHKLMVYDGTAWQACW